MGTKYSNIIKVLRNYTPLKDTELVEHNVYLLHYFWSHTEIGRDFSAETLCSRVSIRFRNKMVKL